MSHGASWTTLRSFTRDPSLRSGGVSRETWRRIGDLARPYRRQLAVFLVLVVLSSAAAVATPLLLAVLINRGVVAGDRGVVLGVAGVVAALALVEGGITLAQRWYSSRIGEGLIYDLRTSVFAHVQRQPVSFFTRAQTGALVTRLNTDVSGAQQAFTTTLQSVVSNVVLLVLAGGVVLSQAPVLLLAVLLLLPLFWVPARRVGRRLSGLTRRSMELNADLGTRMTERFNVAGALLVTLYGRPDEEDEQFRERADRVRRIGTSIAMSNRVFFTALTTVTALATALVYGVGGLLAIGGRFEVGTVVALAALMGRLYGPITSLANVRVDVMSALVSFERVFEVLDLPSPLVEVEGAVDLPEGPLDVRLDGVGFTYPRAGEGGLRSLEGVTADAAAADDDGDGDGADAEGRREVVAPGGPEGGPALADVDLHVPAGQVLALVGRSGAGKTTATALVARLYDPTEGRVLVGGVDLREARLASVHDRIGVVTQDAHLFHDTVRANLLYARPGASEAELLAALEAAQVLDVVRDLPEGLDTVVGDRGHRLSGGEKQRVALARLLLKAPDVVVLDEATAHLDSRSEAAVQRALERALEGRTSIVIAHRLSTVRSADLIAVVDAGRVVQTGTHEELLAQGGPYAVLHRTQLVGAGGPLGDAAEDAGDVDLEGGDAEGDDAREAADRGDGAARRAGGRRPPAPRPAP
ncbi:ABC transporter ATP-binding protein [Pseudokineococcus marinus]|uniref:ABC transporter ATP-binding protein n=1 Tax=Pseudokineococcus marinus TaxID=351215 RepID=A0A849BRD3_9ACTN|nr:ABC transporter ATP-binding protein [Pseudokineococcus marinus]NNH24075.1 ABC transporter ATP-binding protein [Pseudokineococcus marinus]